MKLVDVPLVKLVCCLRSLYCDIITRTTKIDISAAKKSNHSVLSTSLDSWKGALGKNVQQQSWTGTTLSDKKGE